MLLWIVIAFLTAAAVMSVLVPLARRAGAADPLAEARRVYLDQLSELERDQVEGRIGVPEAEAARVEIARRLLGTEDVRTPGPIGEGSQTLRRATALLALIGIPLLSLGTYVALGAPDLQGQPLAGRLAEPSQTDDLAALVLSVEAHLADTPEDGRGWDVIAPIYLRLGRAADAAAAYRNAIRILGSDEPRQSGLGEALLTVTGGVVTAEAKAAFAAANLADPNAARPRFFLGLASEQEGDKAGAARQWRALLEQAPADAPWRASVQAALARVEPPSDPGSPSAQQVAAAQAAAPAEQAAMIEGMVSGLAGRLASRPDDVQGWLRLIRSYMVLGRPADAQRAANAAIVGVSDPAEREQVKALMADLGLAQGSATR